MYFPLSLTSAKQRNLEYQNLTSATYLLDVQQYKAKINYVTQ